MEAPKCRNCGKREWQHVCMGNAAVSVSAASGGGGATGERPPTARGIPSGSSFAAKRRAAPKPRPVIGPVVPADRGDGGVGGEAAGEGFDRAGYQRGYMREYMRKRRG